MMIRLLAILFVTMLLSSCSGNGPEVDQQEKIKPFVGSYSYDGTAIHGIVSFYDTVGNYLGMGYDTIQFENETLELSLLGDTDTLVVDGLLYSWNFDQDRKQVQGILENGSIQLIYDKSDLAFNRKITGTLHIDEDALELEYVWDRSDVWSGVPPVKGFITGNGMRVE